MNINEAVFTIDEAADICRLHHSRIREMLRHATVKIGHKPSYAIFLTAKEIVALMVARELVCAGYASGAALDAAHGVVSKYEAAPRFDHRAAFPLSSQMGRTHAGPNALARQVGTKIAIDIASIWSLVETRCDEIYEETAA